MQKLLPAQEETWIRPEHSGDTDVVVSTEHALWLHLESHSAYARAPMALEATSLHVDKSLKLCTGDKLLHPACSVGASSSSSYCTTYVWCAPKTSNWCKLHCWFKCNNGCVVLELCWIAPVLPSLHHMSWQSHTQSCRRQQSSSSSCLLHVHFTHRTCFCSAPEERK